MKKMVLLIVLAIFAIVALLYFLFKDNSYLSFNDSKKTYEVLEKWELPEELDEISGMSWIGNGKIACIQDEDGIIFIYDLNVHAITSRIEFGDKGDYEAVTLNGSDAYVMRSDGHIFEVENYANRNFTVNEYQTPLEDYDIEGLAYDKENNRLLITVKDVPHEDQDYKGVYAFVLEGKEFIPEPVFKINTNDPIFKGINGRGSQRIIRPSEIEKNPLTGNWYILEGHQPKLMILDAKGEAKQVHLLDPEVFQQAEGLTFSPDGTMYISNESRRAPANILEVKLDTE
ncbi:SdiA-regulated domain-containing protein [Zunongwangia sp. F363]|uniref:SdiA-regulated domain-containing protein n=1 Tax=Autumnicola tepida TaxID=3075595 RepID=A0ABU3C657_9FLAO|nr:SdiA-regulated domain-containing protein [Zunongwangia sp. F363]MDT0641758.1 SdiA-regulated domain-containing protein [Zunongwangia sp. F363]